MPSLPRLRELLEQHFDVEGLRDLCASLHIDYDDIRGEAQEEKVRELILYLDRRGRLPELLEACVKQRPDLSWDIAPGPAIPQSTSPAKSGPFEHPTRQEKEAQLVTENAKLHASLRLSYDFARFRTFMQEAFTPQELVEFIGRDDVLKGLKFSLPVNASHDTIAREMLEYAQRRNIVGQLLDALEKHNPALYAQHGPFEVGQLDIRITLGVRGDAARLRALKATPLDAETEQRLLQVVEQAILQAGGQNRA
jgi:hypothetical protein